MANMPITSQSNDPFFLEVLQAEEKLSSARRVIKRETHHMTYSLGRAVGDLVRILGISPTHFESGETFRPLSFRGSSNFGMFIGVWAIWQDFKFYNADGCRKRTHWSLNSAFRDGALQGYQAHSGLLATFSNTISGREVIEIHDSESDLSSSDDDDHIPMGLEDWIQNTVASQTSMHYFASDKNRWMTKEDDLDDDFFTELREMAALEDVNGLDSNADGMIEGIICVSETDGQDQADSLASNGQEMDTDAVVEGAFTTPLTESPKKCENLHELLADVLRMHGEASNSELAVNREMEYGFCWTGM